MQHRYGRQDEMGKKGKEKIENKNDSEEDFVFFR